MILAFIGETELMMIAGLALLLFGGKKLPEIVRGLGRGVREFKEGTKEVTSILNNNDPYSLFPPRSILFWIKPSTLSEEQRTKGGLIFYEQYKTATHTVRAG